MHDIFISYSSADEPFARFLHRHLTSEGLSVFLASVSLVPGQKWSSEIRNALHGSTWILFLASRSACTSPWVQQELGVALAGQKKLVPIVWDIPPSQLPGWIGQFQALDIARNSPAEVQAKMSAIAERMKADKARGQMISAFLLAGLFVLAFSGKG